MFSVTKIGRICLKLNRSQAYLQKSSKNCSKFDIHTSTQTNVMKEELKIQHSKDENKLITVFYDGKCGLCNKEIDHYRKISPVGIFHWQDITKSNNADLTKAGISLSEGLKLLHSIDSNGKLHVGVDSFILIWKQLNRWRILAFVVSLPPIRQIADILYKIFAQKRFDRLEHCQLAARQDSKNTKNL